jgi:hypothetical protein
MVGFTIKDSQISFCSVVVSFVLTTSLALAQTRSFAERGVIELGGSISFKSSTNVEPGYPRTTLSLFDALPYAGYFVADGFEIGINPLGVSTSGRQGAFGPGTQTSVMILIAPSYNLKTGGIAFPFIEGLFGYTSMFTSSYPASNGFSWGGRIGVKLAVADHGLLNLGAQYLLLSYNPTWAKERFGSNDLTIAAGFTLWL